MHDHLRLASGPARLAFVVVVFALASACNGTAPEAPSGVDLVITSGILVTGHAVPGGTVSLSQYVVTNVGTAAAGPFVNGYFLSVDNTITTTDRQLFGLAAAELSGLAAGALFRFPADEVTIPDDLAPGEYFVGVVVDYTNLMDEAAEFNNTAAFSIRVFADPG